MPYTRATNSMFCWWCSTPLVKNNHTHQYVYVTIKSPDGIELKVHKCCEENAKLHMKPGHSMKPGQFDVG